MVATTLVASRETGDHTDVGVGHYRGISKPMEESFSDSPKAGWDY